MPRLVDHTKQETELLELIAAPRDKKQTRAMGEPRGFVIRLQPVKYNSAPCYLVYRMEPCGRVHWLPIGIFPDRSLSELRDRARSARELVLRGVDPRGIV